MRKRRKKDTERLELNYGNGTEGPEKAAAYLRVSTPDQGDKYSLGFQRKDVSALAKKLGLVVPDGWLIEEVMSAADAKRPGFRRLWELVENSETNGLRHVLAYDTDRLARDPLDVGIFVRHCKDHGVTPHFADGSSVETFLDEVIQYLKGAFAKEEREKIARRTMGGKRAAAGESRMPNGVGRGRYGVRYNKEEKTWEIDEDEAWAVVLMHDWRLAGVSGCGIARRLDDMGIPSKHGGNWSGSVVLNILRNEANTGSMWWGTKRYEKYYGKEDGPLREVSLKPVEEWIWLDNFAPAIVSREMHEAVQEVMQSNPRRGQNWEYVLSSYFTCGECGSSVTGSTQYWNGGVYPYYRCSGTLGGDYREKVCDMTSSRADKLEPVVLEHIMKAVNNPEEVVNELKRMAADGGAKLEERIVGLKSKVKRHRHELGKLTMREARGDIDQEMYENLSAPVKSLLAGLEKEIAIVEDQKKVNEGWDQLDEQVAAAFAKFGRSLDELDDEELQRLMGLLCLKVTAGRGRVLVTGLLGPSLVTIGQTSA